jgi:hypothetical protein
MLRLQQGPEADARDEISRIEELSPLPRFPLSHVSIFPESMNSPPPEFDRDEVLVCMALAFCLAGASTSIVYRLLG